MNTHSTLHTVKTGSLLLTHIFALIVDAKNDYAMVCYYSTAECVLL